MSWLVDWNSKEVFFHIANAFEGDYTWFSLGFSKRGEFERSDLCIFQWQNDLFNAVVVCVKEFNITILLHSLILRVTLRMPIAVMMVTVFTLMNNKTASYFAWMTIQWRLRRSSTHAIHTT